MKRKKRKRSRELELEYLRQQSEIRFLRQLVVEAVQRYQHTELERDCNYQALMQAVIRLASERLCNENSPA